MCAIDIVRPTVETARLVLRRPMASDAHDIATLANDRGVVGMLSTWPYPFGVADAEAWLDRIAGLDPRRRADFVIEHREFGSMGVIGIGDNAEGRPELGYWLGRPFWGRGFATEAVTAMLDWVRADWRKSVVWAGHFADNPASGEVLCKAGFLYTGDVAPKASLGRDGAMTPNRMMVWLA